MCNFNMFLFSCERQDAQGRGNQLAYYEDPRPPRMVEDHLPYQHLRHARGFPTPCPPLRLRGVQRKDGFPFFGQDKIIFEKLFFSRGI